MVCQIIRVHLCGSIYKGKDNLVADALSRKVENEDDLASDMLSSKSKSVNLTFENDLDS